MKTAQNGSPVLVEIEWAEMRATFGASSLAVGLQRRPDGLLREECLAELTERWREFVAKNEMARSTPAWCALGARGVTLRRFKLPRKTREDLTSLLALQMESELPLPPRELAWGYVPIQPEKTHAQDANGTQEYLVAALKKELLKQYDHLLAAAGLQARFLLSAAALVGAFRTPLRQGAVFKVGYHESEWAIVEDGVPASVRSLPWGLEHILDALAEQTGTDRPRLAQALGDQAVPASQVQQAVRASLASHLSRFTNDTTSPRLGVSVPVSAPAVVADAVLAAVGNSSACERLCEAGPAAVSPVFWGCQDTGQDAGRGPMLTFHLHESTDQPAKKRAATWVAWAILAAALLVALTSLRYVEPWLGRNKLKARVAQMQSAWDRRPDIDREWLFLQYFETNRPPYLHVMALLADAAGRGTKVESLSLNRRGEMSLRGEWPDAKRAGEFRSQLISSGWFSAVVLEEQTPVKNQKKVKVHLNGRWRFAPQPPGADESPDAETAEEEPDALSAETTP